ncbi:MAG TPA: LuxR C-terminal-related transcriptional regulator [Gaiellaceae bacterium]|nr:LuxR C-terminal-related transcriptional regulator [Gaiellaceae bacterium]
MTPDFRSGDPLLAFDGDLRVVRWNEAAERLTGIPAGEAVGRRCWEVLGGIDDRGGVVCHRGCAAARLAREGWPVPAQEIQVRTAQGRVPVSLSTVAVRSEKPPLYLHILRPVREPAPAAQNGVTVLTPRRREVLVLLAEGVPAKLIAARLGLAEATVRNHIRGLLAALGVHSQLEAVAVARRRGLLDG